MPDLPPLPPLDDTDTLSASAALPADVQVYTADDGAFLWPTPPFATYAPPSEQIEHEPCEIEGLNGKQMSGRLALFEPREQLAHVQLPPSRTTVPLRFRHFRSMLLTRPLKPLRLTDGGNAELGQLLGHRSSTPYTLNLSDGQVLEGLTVGHVELGFGLFLFPPEGTDGAVQRLFVPRDAYTHADLGGRIGEVLVASQVVTPEQVARAVEVQQHMRTQKLGDILLSSQVVNPEQLLVAISQQKRMPMVRIGEALLALGLVTQAQLDDALAQQQRDRGVPLGEVLIQLEFVSRQDLKMALARKMGYPVVDVGKFPVEAEALRKLPYAVAARLEAMPLLLREGSLIVALEDPSQRKHIDELAFITQCKIVPVLAEHRQQMDAALYEAYARIGADLSLDSGGKPALPAVQLDLEGEDSSALIASLELEGRESGVEEERAIEQSDNSLVRLINTMIIEAHQQGVSDIHIESYPGKEKVKIRFRKDGALVPYLELPHNYRTAVIARVKIMCDLDISERRKPQDGKINFARFVPQHKIELRVATIPTNNGLEDVVMRILASAKPLPLDKIGLSPWNLERLKAAMERPYGLVLCVGPTGSGKTTTLHSALSFINVPERKIWTAEDPVEITQPGLRQVQVNPKIDWTFAKALRAFLRADPDVIMVGEMRDAETASMGVEASLTGHLVLSTLHTNSAPETVTRLLDMGMDPFNFADSLLVVLAQRLVRRLCTQCRVSEPMPDEEAQTLLADFLHVCPPDPERFDAQALMARWQAQFGREGRLMKYHSPGCPHCNHTGYKGRAGIHELMVVSRELRRLIQTGARAEELQRQALFDGMQTLRQDGIEKVLMGITGMEEVRATSNT
ncbi:ATPase, T2SS/T4P/T4SS family [Aquabacterium lacunae]|uniref:GspE/PulE family protein n=1 Tax=Aquabacterium lacunae TaxID=2528630 RepID=UPI0026BCBECE